MTVRLTIMSNTTQIELLFAALLSGDSTVAADLDALIGDGLKLDGKTYMPIVQKGYKRGSTIFPAKRVAARFAVVTPGNSIRLVGLAYPGEMGDLTGNKRPYDRTFALGDWAEYDSYNLSYHGKITNIGPGGNVTIAKGNGSSKSARLDAETFTWRNYDLDLCAAAARNSDVMASS